MATSLASSITATAARVSVARPGRPSARSAIVCSAAPQASGDASVSLPRRQALLGVAALGAALAAPGQALAGPFDGINPLRAPMTEAPPEFDEDTLHLIETMRGMDSGSKVDPEGFRAEGDAWVENYKFNHFGKDSAYLLTFKAYLAIKAACNEANGNVFSQEARTYDPSKVNYKKDVINRFMNDAEGFINGTKKGSPSA